MASVNHIRARCDTIITILVWRHNSIRAKCVTIKVWRSGAVCVWGIPLVFNICVWVPGFSATAWFLSHISEMERQSYCTIESCLHGTAASIARAERVRLFIRWALLKQGCGLWDSSVRQEILSWFICHYSWLWWGIQAPSLEHLDSCTKIKL